MMLEKVDIIITDLPYGKLVNWKSKEINPTVAFFEKILKIVTSADSIVAVIANKQQKLFPNDLLKIDGFKVGQRQIKIFQKII